MASDESTAETATEEVSAKVENNAESVEDNKEDTTSNGVSLSK